MPTTVVDYQLIHLVWDPISEQCLGNRTVCYGCIEGRMATMKQVIPSFIQ